MLHIQGLKAQLTEGGKAILQGVNLHIPAGEVHAIMGPNGAGKSTLANVLAGREGYAIQGVAELTGQNVLGLEPAARAHAGLFLAFQYPVELQGVNAAQFLRTAVNAHRKVRGEKELNGADFLKLVRAEMAKLKMDETFLKRSVNAGLSGGEKKRFEILQMALIQPKMCILDETDSGLDIDALKIVAEGVNNLRLSHRSFLIITHYQRLLDYIQPDKIHIMAAGQIRLSGGPELAKRLESEGYDGVMAA